MPVEDHEVHEKVKQKEGFRYGCNSRTGMATGYFAPDRVYKEDGTYITKLVRIPHVMSTPCRNFYLWDTDSGCRECTTIKDVEYANKMKGLT